MIYTAACLVDYNRDMLSPWSDKGLKGIVVNPWSDKGLTGTVVNPWSAKGLKGTVVNPWSAKGLRVPLWILDQTKV